jgi:hypothetical protein
MMMMTSKIDDKLEDMHIRNIATKSQYIKDRYNYVKKNTKLSYREIDNFSKLAIITSVEFGVDRYRDKLVTLRLSIMINDSIGTSIAIPSNYIIPFIIDYDVCDINTLKGKPITVIQYSNMIYWLEPSKIKLSDK